MEIAVGNRCKFVCKRHIMKELQLLRLFLDWRNKFETTTECYDKIANITYIINMTIDAHAQH